MATAAELKEQVDQLQLQLKELSARKMVYSKDGKFPKLTREVDVTEWLQSIGDFVRNRFGDKKESVMFVMDHLEKEAKTEVRFRICLDKATLDEVLQVLHDLYGSKDSAVQLQQQFYSRNQVAGETAQDYALDLMTKLNAIVEAQPGMYKSRDDMIKHKFAEGVLDLGLRRELRRLNEERPTLQFWEVRQHAITWVDSVVSSHQAEVSSEVQASSESLKYSDMCLLLEKQQKQIEDLTAMMKDLKDNSGISSGVGQAGVVSSTKKKNIICHYCKKPGHIKANCFKLKSRKEHLNSSNPVGK